KPPVSCATSIAIGMVADFGASDSKVWVDPFNSQAIPRADKIAVQDPARRATQTGSQTRFKRPSWPYKGTASATVAGPIRKVRSCVFRAYTGYGVFVSTSNNTTMITAVNTGSSKGWLPQRRYKTKAPR